MLLVIHHGIFCRVRSVLHAVQTWCVMKFSPFLCLSSLSFKQFRDDENMLSRSASVFLSFDRNKVEKSATYLLFEKNIKIFLKAFTPYDNHEDQIKFPKLAVLKKINRAINFSKSLPDQAPF